MAVVCDTAVLIAADRRERRVAALAQAAGSRDEELIVPVGCVAQAWRAGARQAPLARFLSGCRERPLDSHLAREIGGLLAVSCTRDIVDAGVALAARPGDCILTADTDDLQRLIDAAGTGVRVLPF